MWRPKRPAKEDELEPSSTNAHVFETTPSHWRLHTHGIVMSLVAAVMGIMTMIHFGAVWLILVIVPLLFVLLYVNLLPVSTRRMTVDFDRRVLQLEGFLVTKGFWSLGRQAHSLQIPFASLERFTIGTSPRSTRVSLRVWTKAGFFEVPQFMPRVEEIAGLLTTILEEERSG